MEEELSKLSKLSISDFADALASAKPVPGGGGAAALASALGIALGDMVGEFTLGKKKYADVEDDIRLLMERAQKLKSELIDCIEKDAAAFEPLSRAYGIPKEDPARDEVMEECLREAAKPPMRIVELSCEAISILKGFWEKGSRIMISDAATGAALCRGALLGGAINVKVNTKLMKDCGYAKEVNEKVERMVAEYSQIAQQIYEGVYSAL